MTGDARHGNPTLEVWLDSAYDGFRDTGGGSVEDFVAWLEGPDGPDTPSLYDYAAGERTYVGYAADPETLIDDTIFDCLEDAIGRSGLTIAGNTPSIAELSDAIQGELDRGRGEGQPSLE